jgi:hypothetical protein
VRHRSLEESLVLLSDPMPRLVDDSGYLLVLVGLPRGLPSEQLAVTGTQERLELVLVIEGR